MHFNINHKPNQCEFDIKFVTPTAEHSNFANTAGSSEWAFLIKFWYGIGLLWTFQLDIHVFLSHYLWMYAMCGWLTDEFRVNRRQNSALSSKKAASWMLWMRSFGFEFAVHKSVWVYVARRPPKKTNVYVQNSFSCCARTMRQWNGCTVRAINERDVLIVRIYNNQFKSWLVSQTKQNEHIKLLIKSPIYLSNRIVG